MKNLLLILTSALIALFVYGFSAIPSNSSGLSLIQDKDENRTYEIRYWQNMSQVGGNDIMIDTMVYYGKDRAGFDYSSADCVSYFCKEEDNLIYSILDKIEGEEKEWQVKDWFIRKLSDVTVDFRAKRRTIQKIYISDHNNRNTGVGNYTLVSKEFGVICRWNIDGEFYQLIRIDIVKDDQVMEELDLLPLFEKLFISDIFTK